MNDAQAAIDFYARAFGATLRTKSLTPDGKRIMHSEVQIGNSVLMIVDEFPENQVVSPHALKGSPVMLHIFCDNVDEAWKQAVAAGCTVTFPLQDAFWGDRFGALVDPFGHTWSLATRPVPSKG